MVQSSNGSGPWVAFLVGGLILAVAVISYLVYAGRQAAPELGGNVDINLTVPKPPSMPDGPELPDSPIPTPR